MRWLSLALGFMILNGPPLDAATFTFPLDATYTVTEPLKHK